MQDLADFVKSNSRPDSNALVAQLAESNRVIECQKHEIALLKQKLKDESKKGAEVIQRLSEKMKLKSKEIADLKHEVENLTQSNLDLKFQSETDTIHYNNLKCHHFLLTVNNHRSKMERNNENTAALLEVYLRILKNMMKCMFEDPITDDKLSHIFIKHNVTKAHVKSTVDEINRLRIKHKDFSKFVCNPDPSNKEFCDIAVIILTTQAENLIYPPNDYYGCLVQIKVILQYIDSLFEVEGC